MKHGSFGKAFGLGAGFALLLTLGACTEGELVSPADEALLVGAADFIPPSGGPGDPDPTAFGKTAGAPDTERFEVCKRWVGNPGVATFEVSGPVLTHQTSTDDGSWFGPFDALGESGWFCRDVWLEGAAGQIVTVTEIAAVGPNPYTLTVDALGSPGFNVPTIGADFVSGLVNGFDDAGVTAFFTNTEEGGDEGCTPGYWKQEHHHDSWGDYAPGDDFNAVFGVGAINLRRPETGTTAGMTLQEGLELRGGGVNALIRHAVAALLNADQGFYPLSEAQVIAAFQAAVGGGDINGTKDTFAGFNELGCPLN